MLAITASDRCYISDILEKINYTKEESPNKSELYKCRYKEHTFIILVTGYGKINIGSSLRFMCSKYPVKAILSIGTAGSIIDSVGIFNVVIPNSTLEFDVDFIPVGYIDAQIPKLEKSFYNTNDDLSDCLRRACKLCGVNYSNDIIASSDMFVSNYNLAKSIKNSYNAVAVDTESGCVGQYCYTNNIAYACLKVISNFANNNGAKQYNLYDKEANLNSQRIIKRFLKEFYEA